MIFKILLLTLLNLQETTNQTLTDDLKQEQNQPASSQLYYNIGNAYFELNQTPQAILYYNRALAIDPSNKRAKKNLSIALKKLELPTPAPAYFPAASTLYKLFALFASLTFLLLSITLWFRKGKGLSIISISLTLLTLALLGYRHYFIPLEGILIQASNLNPTSEKPLPAGTKVQVLAETKEGTSLEIRTEKGDIGYVPQESIRLI